MYPNLKAEMARVSMTMLGLSERTGIPYSTLNQKMNGKTEFTFQEAVDIRKALGVDVPLDELFDKAVKV